MVVADQARARRIIDGKAAHLRNRSEQELAGYGAALDYLFSGGWRPLNVGLLLHLHRLLWEHTAWSWPLPVKSGCTAWSSGAHPAPALGLVR